MVSVDQLPFPVVTLCPEGISQGKITKEIFDAINIKKEQDFKYTRLFQKSASPVFGFFMEFGN